MEYIMSWFNGYGLSQDIQRGVSISLLILFILILSIVVNFITKRILLNILTQIIKKDKFKWNKVLLERKVFHKLSHIAPVIMMYLFASAFPENISNFIYRVSSGYFVLIAILVIDALINAVHDIYKTNESSKYRPIKGYLQVLKIFIYLIGGIQIIASLIGENPWLLISGVGAMSAVLLLVFRDSLLGLVAGIQLSTNDMMRIGDWIEMPKYGADGDVIDISLNTVKVENFDMTITTIPTYALVSDSFKNWRGMIQAGGRRIMRSVYIDITSISFCSSEMLERFEKIHYLTQYINIMKQEISAYNEENNLNTTNLANGKHLTNIGVFRIYIDRYIKNHPNIHQGMYQIVRQLPPAENGLPIQIYAFTNEIEWSRYEAIQSDIFDHILAVVPEFELRIYQHPTGHDIRRVLNSEWKDGSQITQDNPLINIIKNDEE
ncbi:mechanosensitive ion channel [Alkalibaculum sp. M08DMB]|uniref:Mechanosensing system component YbdG n=1 Tax=Alkalibaculum sporogenes TaxID=2655001 RepID=A0A6A7KC47_9FIRM|nr:mechanosensitive ion channel [Alkalibaculum sporogenes]